MKSNDVKALVGLVVALLVLWFAIAREGDRATAVAIVGLAIIYARTALVLAGAVVLAAVVLLVPLPVILLVFLVVGLLGFAVHHHTQVWSGRHSRDSDYWGGGDWRDTQHGGGAW
jgi:hypothetical protein